jgi:hypothetical protein
VKAVATFPLFPLWCLLTIMRLTREALSLSENPVRNGSSLPVSIFTNSCHTAKS